jgi:threonylcarbamoyladenosine tRNA methylthiotransferase MtaB
MRVALTTLGCRLNQSETDAMEAALSRAGHAVVGRLEDADVFVLNSCTITHQADADARQWVRRARRANPDLKVVVTGCYANADPEGVAAIGGVDAVLGNGDKDALESLLGRVDGRSGTPLIEVSSLVRKKDFVPLRAAAPRTRSRALLKIQDGCNYRCSFCIVPQVRGASRSLDIPEVVAQLQGLVGSGAPEVVLTGIHLGTWGRDLRPRRRLHELVAALLPHLGDAKLRLSSLDPHEVDDELIDLMAAHPDQICRHLHLPVQSGDPETLKRMRRGHTAEDFVRLTRTLAERIDGIGIGTDVIVGFPGESDEAFERTAALLESLPVTYHHVFSYSKRRGTAAATMDGQIPKPVMHARNTRLRELSQRQFEAFAARHVGRVLDGVVEERRSGQLQVVTDNYLRLHLDAAAPTLVGRRARVRVLDERRAVIVP